MAAIAQAPALLAEARAALPALKSRAWQAAGEEGVQAVVSRRFALFPQPERGPQEWAAWWLDYFEALAEVSLGSLEAAMAAWVRRPDAEFMPKPGALLALSRTVPCRDIQAFERAQGAVRLAEGAARLNAPRTIDPPKLRPVVAAPDRARVRRMAEAYAAQVCARRRPAPAPPMRPAPTDEAGLTGHMRAWLAQRSL